MIVLRLDDALSLFAGADIKNICNEAALVAARHEKTSIDHTDFDYAMERVIAGVARKSRVLSPQELRVVAYHEAGHALVGWLLEHTDALLKVTIKSRTSSILGFAQYAPTERRLISKEEVPQAHVHLSPFMHTIRPNLGTYSVCGITLFSVFAVYVIQKFNTYRIVIFLFVIWMIKLKPNSLRY